MQWIAPTEKDTATDTLEKRLWSAANQLWAGAGLKQSDYSEPILGLIFLRFAEVRFSARRAELEKAGASARRGSKVDDPTAYHAEGVLFLASGARFAELLQLPEGTDIGKALNEAMKVIERDNPQMAGVLPKGYQVFDSRLLSNLLKTLSTIPADLEGDAFGKIYEYFLGTFAMSEGQKGGEFFTPTSIVRFLVEVLEPFHGRILDPACGSGGMFVQSARFVSAHKRNPSAELSIHGQERVDGNVRLARMNLAVHGLEGEIKHGNTYYEDLHSTVGRFDFVCANPPFNVSQVDKERLSAEVGTGRRYPFGLPRTDNANYLWIQDFYSALNDQGRAGFVMANSASDARASEQDIRQKLIEARAVDVMVAVGPNMFYTVTLPCTLWFFDKGKAKTPRADTVLFIDARHIYRQIDRAHRDWTDAQISFMANIVRLYRGEEPDYTLGGEEAKAKLLEVFAAQPSPQPSPNGRGGFDFSGLVERARQLRKNQTPAEEVLWEILRNRQFHDLKFRRQHQIGEYIVDLYCHEHNLVIEADGDVHDADHQKKHDKKRDAYLSSIGMTVLRFRNEDILNNTDSVLRGIASALPSPLGRRAGDEGKSAIAYRDVAGLCKAATLAEIEAQGWSLNPGRYVGVAPGEAVSDEDFKTQLGTWNEELETLNAQARELEQTIAANVAEILEA
ncbi:MAG: N-6 DNA methylase [Verrucomicrobiaceae bacterium]|nr:N-6 DNA methylase [Verrucomicrobiaceae bacterium]